MFFPSPPFFLEFRWFGSGSKAVSGVQFWAAIWSDLEASTFWQQARIRTLDLTFDHGSRPMLPFWDRCTTPFQSYFSGDWDVHWGYDLDFDPWPFDPAVLRLRRTS